MVHHVRGPELPFEMMIYSTSTMPDDFSRDGMEDVYK